jgi:hypothetical protein
MSQLLQLACPTAPNPARPPSKNRVGGSPRSSALRAPKTRSQLPESHRVSRPAATITASGRPVWPSRDPIGEKGGMNLYGVVRNNLVSKIDRLGLMSGDLVSCCCAIRKYNSGWDATIKKLEQMFLEWESGETWTDYGLTQFANAAGGRSDAYHESPQCVKDAADKIENENLINTMMAVQLIVIGGHGYWNPLNWIYQDDGFAEEQWWLTHITIELFRAKWFKSELDKLSNECVERLGEYKSWEHCLCP